MHNLKDHIEIRRVGSAVTAGSSIDNNSSRIDMSGYESVRFFVTITDSVATGVATLKIEHNDADSDTGMTAISGAQQVGTSAANDDLNDKVLAVEVRRPAKRYVQAVRVSATANIAYGEVYAELIPLRKPPAVHATMLSGALSTPTAGPVFVQD